MSTPLISVDYPQVLVEDVIYACPAKACVVISSAVLEFSLTTATTDFAAVAASTTGFTSSFPFVRCTSTAPTVSFKRLA